jgi:Family of unknown function (DUF6491)
MKYLTIATLAASVLAVAPAGAVGEEGDAPRCVRLININGYSVIDREHVVLRGGANRHYLLTTRHSCPDLNYGIRISTSFPDSTTLCAPLVEYITPENGMRCSIDTVEAVDSVEAARELISARADVEAQAANQE